MNYWGYAPYVSVAAKKARAARKLAALRKKQSLDPVVIQGSAIARTWWGKAWNRNLEHYADYSNRIGRGRSYVRHGAVLDLRIEAGQIKALVQGSRSKPYEIFVNIRKLKRNTWRRIISECSGMLDSLPDLLSGHFPGTLGDIFMRRDDGLFPALKEIKFECSCPDWAGMCKHVAATLYGVGARLDQAPALFFTLRGVEMHDLIGRTIATKTRHLLDMAGRKSPRILADADLTRVFGIELAGSKASKDNTLTQSKNSISPRTEKAPASTRTRISKKNPGKPRTSIKSKPVRSKHRSRRRATFS